MHIEIPKNLNLSSYSDVKDFFYLTNIQLNRVEDVVDIWWSFGATLKQEMSLGRKLCFDVIPQKDGSYKVARDVFTLITPDTEPTKSYVVNIY